MTFAAQYPAYEFPLSTLPHPPCGWQDMTRVGVARLPSPYGTFTRYNLPVLIGASQLHPYNSIEPPRPAQCGVNGFGTIGSSKHKHAGTRFQPIE